MVRDDKDLLRSQHTALSLLLAAYQLMAIFLVLI